MKLISSEKIETNKYELKIAVSKEEFESAVTDAFNKNKKNINVPGFRKGKAPRTLIEKMYGKEMFYNEAIEATYGKAYDEAVVEAAIEPVDMPQVELISTEFDNGYEFSAVVFVKPEITVKDYKKIKAEAVEVNVADDEVKTEIDRTLDKNARVVTVEERAAADGDIANIDFEGFVDGVAFEGGKGQNYDLTLGSGTFIPGFEDQVVGKEIGASFDVNVKFPAEYGAENLADKDAVFKVTLNSLKVRELPAFDDEFVKDVSDFNTVAEYTEDVKAKMLEAKKKNSDAELENALMDKVIEGIEGEIPEVMYDRKVDQLIEDTARRLQSQGLNLETYLKYTGMEMADFRRTFEEQATKQVKIRLALEKIVEVEGISATDEEIEAEFAKIAEMYKLEVEKVKEVFPQTEVVKEVSLNKAIDLIRDTADVKIVKEKKTETKAAAKKPAAKKAPAKKAAAKKTEEKSETAAAEKKAPAKKAPAKKPAAKKPAAKKAKADDAE